MDRSANDVVDEFAAELEAIIRDEGGSLVRLHESHSDRGFLVVRPPSAVRFVAKLSQSPKPFWGLGVAKAGEMVTEPGQFLVLLTSSNTGYVLSPVRLRILLPKLGTDEAKHDYKIQAGKVVKEMRFRSNEELSDFLLSRLNRGAPES